MAAAKKWNVHHHDGRHEVIEDNDFVAKEYLKDLQDPAVTHIAVGDAVYHKGSIKSITPFVEEKKN